MWIKRGIKDMLAPSIILWVVHFTHWDIHYVQVKGIDKDKE